jgi:hypothetical protein
MNLMIVPSFSARYQSFVNHQFKITLFLEQQLYQTNSSTPPPSSAKNAKERTRSSIPQEWLVSALPAL